jgi:hypothetical protein
MPRSSLSTASASLSIYWTGSANDARSPHEDAPADVCHRGVSPARRIALFVLGSLVRDQAAAHASEARQSLGVADRADAPFRVGDARREHPCHEIRQISVVERRKGVVARCRRDRRLRPVSFRPRPVMPA